MPDAQTTRIYGIIVSALLLLSAGIGWFFYQQSQEMLGEQQRREAERKVLLAQKQTLTTSLDSLSRVYNDVRTDTLLLGFGLEQLATDAERTDLVRRALGGLLASP